MSGAGLPGNHAGPRTSASTPRKTLIFANDKSSGKTTAASAVIVGLLRNHPALMTSIEVREYDSSPRLSQIFSVDDGMGAVAYRDARNAAAFEASRNIAADPNATPWDDLIYDIGLGRLLVDLGSNTFSEFCRVLDDEPHPVYPGGGERVGVVVPVTTASDSIDSGIAAIDNVLGWGANVRVFILEQEYLGRFGDEATGWAAYRDGLLAAEPGRVSWARIGKLNIADIGSVAFRRIDKTVSEAQAMLRADQLKGAALVRALRQARAEIAWGHGALDAVKPIVEWFAA